MVETQPSSSDATVDVLAEIVAPDVAPVRLRVHDASRVEWTVALPLPEDGAIDYEIVVQLEVPSGAVARDAPWDQLQVFTRLDGPAAIASSDDGTVDSIRRGAVTLTRMLGRAKEGFVRHCSKVAQGKSEPDIGGSPFLTIWLDAALQAVRDARGKLTRVGANENALIARERMLVDEFVSVRLLDALAEADAGASGAARSTTPEARSAFDELHARIAGALCREMDYRRSRGFLAATKDSSESLEAYLARASQLKKHFEEVLFLDRETELREERVRLWSAVAGALIGGIAIAVPLQLTWIFRGNIGLGLVALALFTGIGYALREHIKESGRRWLAGKMVRYQSQRALRCRAPAQRLPTRDVVVEAHEWCRQVSRTAPDPLNPEGGASLRVTRVEYLHRGKLRPQADLWRAGVRRVLHIFRYDLSPLFPRLDDAEKPVPVAADGEVNFVPTPRRYQVPIEVALDLGGQRHLQRATIVIDRGGVRRLVTGAEKLDS
jgi:hypothetical protein